MTKLASNPWVSATLQNFRRVEDSHNLNEVSHALRDVQNLGLLLGARLEYFDKLPDQFPMVHRYGGGIRLTLIDANSGEPICRDIPVEPDPVVGTRSLLDEAQAALVQVLETPQTFTGDLGDYEPLVEAITAVLGSNVAGEVHGIEGDGPSSGAVARSLLGLTEIKTLSVFLMYLALRKGKDTRRTVPIADEWVTGTLVYSDLQGWSVHGCDHGDAIAIRALDLRLFPELSNFAPDDRSDCADYLLRRMIYLHQRGKVIK